MVHVSIMQHRTLCQHEINNHQPSTILNITIVVDLAFNQHKSWRLNCQRYERHGNVTMTHITSTNDHEQRRLICHDVYSCRRTSWLIFGIDVWDFWDMSTWKLLTHFPYITAVVITSTTGVCLCMIAVVGTVFCRSRKGRQFVCPLGTWTPTTRHCKGYLYHT